MISKLLRNKYFWIGVAILLVVIYIYYRGKQSNRQRVKIPKGVDIPSGWSARPTVDALRSSMEGSWYNPFSYGTDEQVIWNALTGLNKAQLSLVYNEFNATTGDDLFDWFRGDLSGDDLTRALGYFNGVV